MAVIEQDASFAERAEQALVSGRLDTIPDAELERVLTAASRLYAAKIDAGNLELRAITPEQVTPTDIVVTVTGLLRAAGLSLWDLSMWFQRGGKQ